MIDKVRVRYAPSPTGHLHIGNARTALFNYLFARHNNGTFIIRTEDTDRKRHVETGEASQLENLKWLGISWDEGPDLGGDFGPYRQSERQAIYEPLVKELLEKDLAYRCYATSEELEEMRDRQIAQGIAPHYDGRWANASEEERQAREEMGIKPAIRIRVPEGETYRFKDMVKGEISFDSDSIGGDWVIQKADGTPTYNFAVVVDDHLMEITHVLRGDDHISNTPKQIGVYQAFGWEPPHFGHMTLIINAETGKKLSKRDETILQFIDQYRQRGYLAEAVFNFISLLGWSPVGEDEIFSKDELIEIFDYKRLGTSPAAFDAKKLEWIGNQYIKALDIEILARLVLPFLQETKQVSTNPTEKELEWVEKLTALYQDQMSYAREIVDLGELFFGQEISFDQQAKDVLAGETVPLVLKTFKEKLKEVEDFQPKNIFPAIKAVQKETKVKGKNLFMPIRVATTGEQHGPELADAISLLGKEQALANIGKALRTIEN